MTTAGPARPDLPPAARNGTAPGPAPVTTAPWDDDPVFACAGEMARRMRDHPWHTSPLGTPDRWSQALRTAVSILLRSRYPMILSWGLDFVMLYNDAYIPTLGDKHPGALGGRLAEEFSEIWDAIGPMQRAVLAGAGATWDEDLPLVIERGAGPEETFFTFSYSAVPDDDGRPGGVLAVLSITTPEVVGTRRLALLNDVGSVVAEDVDAARRAIAQVLAEHGSELPGGRLWATVGSATLPVEEFGRPGPRGAQPPDVTDLEGLEGVDRVCLAVGSGEAASLLELQLPPLRPRDAAHRQFLGQLAHHVGQLLDIADARAREVARARALAELDAAKTQFLSTMSHELRTPLTLMLGPVGDVASGRQESLGREQAVRLQHQGRRLLGLVDDLLEVARSESGRLVSRPEPVEVGPLTRQLAAPLLEAAERAGLEVEGRWLVEGARLLDRRLWENVVVNLVGNALKYTLDGRIEVELGADGPDLVLVVDDTGIGIPAEEQPRVFERFHRVRADEGRTFDGAGVGLAIVSDSVAAMGGSIDLSSTPGVGTRVVVRVPGEVVQGRPRPPSVPSDERAAAVLAQAQTLVPPEQAPLPLDRTRGSALDGGRRLLVVDDNPGMREYVADCLAELGTVLVARDGVEALDLLESCPVDLVVSDVMMPRLDGEALLARIRSHPERRDLPVLLLSARAGTEAAVGALGGLADDYLTKPFSREELVARTRAHLELADLRRESQRRRDRDSLLAGVSHDLQTPLATLLGGVALLQDHDLGAEGTLVVESMARAAGDLRALVTELLDRSAVVVGVPLRPRLEDVDLVPLLAQVEVPDGLRLEVAVDPGQRVLADPLRVRRVLLNLLGNAAAAGARRVVLGLVPDGEEVHVRVADDGPGIAPDRVPALFDPARAVRRGPGVGLGLFVSRESARSMGGDLVLVETHGSGTTFDLVLRRADPAAGPS